MNCRKPGVIGIAMPRMLGDLLKNPRGTVALMGPPYQWSRCSVDFEGKQGWGCTGAVSLHCIVCEAITKQDVYIDKHAALRICQYTKTSIRFWRKCKGETYYPGRNVPWGILSFHKSTVTGKSYEPGTYQPGTTVHTVTSVLRAQKYAMKKMTGVCMKQPPSLQPRVWLQ